MTLLRNNIRQDQPWFMWLKFFHFMGASWVQNMISLSIDLESFVKGVFFVVESLCFYLRSLLQRFILFIENLPDFYYFYLDCQLILFSQRLLEARKERAVGWAAAFLAKAEQRWFTYFSLSLFYAFLFGELIWLVVLWPLSFYNLTLSLWLAWKELNIFLSVGKDWTPWLFPLLLRVFKGRILRQLSQLLTTFSLPFQYTPFQISLPDSHTSPSPFCEPSNHSPLQYESSSQCISPQPCLKSSTKLPMQQLPPPQVYFPSPFLLSLTQVPSYFSEPNCQTPLPNLSPFLNSPLQTDPLLQQYVPLPYGFPLEYVPSYRSPLLNNSNPFPCLYPFLTSPLYYESADLMNPSPSGLLYFQEPEQNSSPDCHLPCPCFMPLTKLPWQISWLAQMKMPF